MSQPSSLTSPSDQSGLVRTLRIVRERWWVIAITAVTLPVVALALALSGTKQYDATSKLLFRDNTLPEQVGGSSGPPDVDPEATKATRVLLITTSEVADRVRQRLKLGLSDDAVAGLVTVEPESNANIIDITARDPDPKRATTIANAWAEEFVAYSQDSARADVQAGLKLLQQRIAQLPPGDSTDRTALSSALGRLVLLEAVQTGDARLVGRASVPANPATPRPKRDAAIALVAGLMLGLGLAFLFDLFDRRVKSIEAFEEQYGFGALTSIPFQARTPSSQRDRQAALEPFRILRNALGLLGSGREVRVVMVSSASAGEGKSTVAAGLARAIALSGQRVVLVEADLRRPTFHQQFNLGDDPRGLTSALVGGVPVGELLRPVLPGLRTLTILPSGPVPPNSAELLRSPEFGALLSELSAEVDLIVLDAPPLLPVADSQILLDHPQVDACIVVARSYQTTRDEIRRARAILDRHRLRSFGLVVNGIREVDAGYAYYTSHEEPPVPAAEGDAGRLAARPRS